MMQKRKNGFTLFEILLVITITLILFGISLPVYQSSQYSSDVENAHKIIVSTIRSAQMNSISGLEDTSWGVKISSNNIIMFSGNTYATRNIQHDLVYTFPGGVIASGVNEIVFSKIIGTTTNIGLINVNKSDQNKQISINKYGIYDY